MLNYEEFKTKMKQEIRSCMSEQYQNMEVSIQRVNKINKCMDGLTLQSQDSKISPTIYLNEMFEHYLKSGSFHDTLVRAAGLMEKAYEEKDRVAAVEYGNEKENIVFQLVNTNQNKEMLSDMPHREFQDLSIVYRWVLRIDQEGIQSTMIRNSLAKSLGFEEEELFHLAKENTKRLLPVKVTNMNDMMREMFKRHGLGTEEIDSMLSELPEDNTMWVITNRMGINGAASMLYEEELHELAEKLNTGLYIMPSSVHEVIAVPATLGEPNHLAQMVAEVNMTEVSLNERLSNQVYYYDKDLRKLTLATDTPNKSLEQVVEETQQAYNPDLIPIDWERDAQMEPEM